MSESDVALSMREGSGANNKMGSGHVRPASVRESSAYKSLPEWLDYIGRIHSKAISMGLDRVDAVRRTMRLYPRFLSLSSAARMERGRPV